MDCLLTGVDFVKGWQRELFVAKWSMHQLVCTFTLLWIFSQLCHSGECTFDEFQSTAKVLAVEFFAWVLMFGHCMLIWRLHAYLCS